MVKLTGWIIYEKGGLWYNTASIRRFKQEADKLSIDLEPININQITLGMFGSGLKLYKGTKEVKAPDFAYFRTYNDRLATQLELMGVKVFNSSRAMAISRDKALTHQIVSNNGIKMPNTLFEKEISDNINYKFIGRKLKYPLVIKETHGSCGTGVYLANNEDALKTLVNSTIDSTLIFQEYIQYSSGRDIRVVTVGDKVVASMLRESKSGFRSNYSLGGSVSKCEIDKETEQLALKTVKIIGLDIAGLDFLFTEKGMVLCEVNSVPGFKTINKCTDVAIEKEILGHIKNKLKG